MTTKKLAQGFSTFGEILTIGCATLLLGCAEWSARGVPGADTSSENESATENQTSEDSSRPTDEGNSASDTSLDMTSTSSSMSLTSSNETSSGVTSIESSASTDTTPTDSSSTDASISNTLDTELGSSATMSSNSNDSASTSSNSLSTNETSSDSTASGCRNDDECTDPKASICEKVSGECVACGDEGTTQGCDDEPGRPLCNDIHVCVAKSGPREVMAWVPAYEIEDSIATLEGKYGTYKPKDGLTHIGLQFWLPTKSGELELDGPDDEDIEWLVQWGKRNDVKVLLTVFNFDEEWDWELAKAALSSDSRDGLIQALLDEIDEYKLDGVDLDLEGNDRSSDDGREDYKTFIIELSQKLRARGKVLTLGAFNDTTSGDVPNEGWLPDWAGFVDYVHIIGYEEMYENAPDKAQSYSAKQNLAAKAGYARSQISMGLPAIARWGDGPALQHLDECIHAPKEVASIAIWDLRFTSFWDDDAHWEKMAQIKNTKD